MHAVVSFEIKIGSTKKPQPPPKPDSHRRCNPPNGNDANQGSVATCGWNTSSRGICLPNKELVNELRSVVSNKSANSGDKHTPSIRANRPSYRPRPAMRLPSKPKIEETTDGDYDSLAAQCVSNGNAAADRRQASRRAPEDRLRIKPASEDQEPSSSSSSDESDESLYKNVGNSIYLERLVVMIVTAQACVLLVLLASGQFKQYCKHKRVRRVYVPCIAYTYILKKIFFFGERC